MNKGLIIALLLGIEGVLFFSFVMPQYREMQGARRSLDARQLLLQDSKTAQSNIMELTNQYTSNEATIARVLLALPKQRQYDYITESFQAAAQSTDMQLVSLVIDDSQKGKGDYQSILIKVELSGQYPQFLVFLDTIEHSLRLYDIAKIDIAEAGISGGSGNNLSITLQGNAYSLK